MDSPHPLYMEVKNLTRNLIHDSTLALVRLASLKSLFWLCISQLFWVSLADPITPYLTSCSLNQSSSHRPTVKQLIRTGQLVKH